MALGFAGFCGVVIDHVNCQPNQNRMLRYRLGELGPCVFFCQNIYIYIYIYIFIYLYLFIYIYLCQDLYLLQKLCHMQACIINLCLVICQGICADLLLPINSDV